MNPQRPTIEQKLFRLRRHGIRRLPKQDNPELEIEEPLPVLKFEALQEREASGFDLEINFLREQLSVVQIPWIDSVDVGRRRLDGGDLKET
jgi:hypothetical protein